MSDSIALIESVKESVLSRLVGVDPSLVDRETRWVLNEFLSGTRVWRRTLDVTLVDATTIYDVPIEDEESVAVLMAATLDGAPMGLGLPSALDTQDGTPRQVGMESDRSVRVWPVPALADAGKVVSVDVALTLLVSVDAAPPDVLRPYQNYLFDGLLARLYAIPDKPWTNVRIADVHLRRFETGKASVKREMDGNRSFGAPRVRFPRFGA